MHQPLKQNWSEIINGNKKYCDSKNKNQDRIISFFIPIRHSYNRGWKKACEWSVIYRSSTYFCAEK